MESFFRFVKGYLTVRVSKKGVARFINLCIRENFDIWNITEGEEYITLNIALRDFYRMQNCVRRAKVKIGILHRYGLRFLLIKSRKYLLFFIGIIVCLCTLYYQKTHVWTLSVEGNSKITKEQIIDALVESGFYAGMQRTDFHSFETEKYLREQFDIFSWVSASLNGTELQISVIENAVEENTNENYAYPSSLYATKDGIIERIMVTRGYSEKKTGETVAAGDLLISGEIPCTNQDGTISYKLVAAEGDYICKITQPYYDDMTLAQDEEIFSSYENESLYLCLNKNVFGYFMKNKSQQNVITLCEYLDLNFLDIFDIHFYLVKKKKANYTIETNVLSEEEAKEQLYNNLMVYMRNLEEKGATEIEPNVSFSSESDHIYLYGDIIYHDSTMLRKNMISGKEEVITDGNDSAVNGIKY